MEITETKYEFVFGDYFARTYFGEYGAHTDWFHKDLFINGDLVPEEILAQHDQQCEELF
jgi:hypothetical protein